MIKPRFKIGEVVIYKEENKSNVYTQRVLSGSRSSNGIDWIYCFNVGVVDYWVDEYHLIKYE